MRAKSLVASIILVAVLLMFLLFFVIPFVYGVFISFTDWDGIAPEYKINGFENYTRMFQDQRFQNSIIVTIKYALVLLTFSLLLGYFSAKAINKLSCFRSPVLFLSFLPYMITPVISCVLWNQMYIGLFPELGKLFEIDFLKTNLLSNPDIALYAVSIVDLWMLIPYAMLLFNSALNSIPYELIESAKLEGATSIKLAWYIEFPHLLSTIGMLTIMIISRAITNIDTILTLTSGGPVRSTETLYYLVYRSSTEELHYAYGMAEGVIVSIFSIFVYFIINKLVIGKYANDITYKG